MGRPTRHFFVCTNERPPGGKPSCGARGAAVLQRLREGLAAHPELLGTTSVTASGCLGPCLDGPTVVVYPEAVWYARVGPSEAAEIVERHMVGGAPVERLRYRWPDDG